MWFRASRRLVPFVLVVVLLPSCTGSTNEGSDAKLTPTTTAAETATAAPTTTTPTITTTVAETPLSEDSDRSGSESGDVAILVARDIDYGPDGRHRLDVYYRNEIDDGAPTALVAHGGIWYVGDKVGISELAELFATRGFVVAVPNYRLVQADGTNAFPTPAEDVACAAAWLEKHATEYGGDATTMLAVGESSGGHLTAMVAFDSQRDWFADDCPNATDANIAFDGYIGFATPYDLRVHPPVRPEVCNMLHDVVGGKGTDCFDADPALFAPANPVDQVTPDDPPALLVTGDHDCTISYPSDPATGQCTASPDAFAAALRSAGVPADMLMLAGVGHEIDYGLPEVQQAVDDFIESIGITIPQNN